MFTQLLDTLEAQGRGIHGYRAVADAAYIQADHASDQAAGYYLLARMAEDFVELNERMPLSVTMIEEMYARLANAAKALSAAYSAKDQTAIIAALNDAARAAKAVHMG